MSDKERRCPHCGRAWDFAQPWAKLCGRCRMTGHYSHPWSCRLCRAKALALMDPEEDNTFHPTHN